MASKRYTDGLVEKMTIRDMRNAWTDASELAEAAKKRRETKDIGVSGSETLLTALEVACLIEKSSWGLEVESLFKTSCLPLASHTMQIYNMKARMDGAMRVMMFTSETGQTHNLILRGKEDTAPVRLWEEDETKVTAGVVKAMSAISALKYSPDKWKTAFQRDEDMPSLITGGLGRGGFVQRYLGMTRSQGRQFGEQTQMFDVEVPLVDLSKVPRMVSAMEDGTAEEKKTACKNIVTGSTSMKIILPRPSLQGETKTS